MNTKFSEEGNRFIDGSRGYLPSGIAENNECAVFQI